MVSSRILGMATLSTSALIMAALGLPMGLGACGDDDPTPPPDGGSCVSTDPACPALGIESDCLALTDNTGKDSFTLRLSQLSVEKPEALTTEIVYNIVSDGVNANLEACNIFGMGTFNFMVSFDKPSDTLTLGGAFPEANPEDGYCYVFDADNEIEPIQVKANLQPDGSFSTDSIPKIVVPIFVDTAATQAVYLPLREGRIAGAQLSADQNCVGAFNDEGLDPRLNCAPDPEAGIEYFVNGGDLDGYVIIEEADAVTVDLLSQSLCVLLSGDVNTYGDGGMPVERCKRDGDGNIELKGDWCSTTNSEGGCQDSFKLQARVAASAAELRTDCPMGTGGGGQGGGGQGGGGQGGGGTGGQGGGGQGGGGT